MYREHCTVVKDWGALLKLIRYARVHWATIYWAILIDLSRILWRFASCLLCKVWKLFEIKIRASGRLFMQRNTLTILLLGKLRVAYNALCQSCKMPHNDVMTFQVSQGQLVKHTFLRSVLSFLSNHKTLLETMLATQYLLSIMSFDSLEIINHENVSVLVYERMPVSLHVCILQHLGFGCAQIIEQMNVRIREITEEMPKLENFEIVPSSHKAGIYRHSILMPLCDMEQAIPWSSI